MKITEQQYAKTLLELTENKSDQDVAVVIERFVLQLKKDGRLGSAKKIIEKFSDLYNKEHGIVEAEIVSREVLRSELRNKVSTYVMNKYQAKEVILKNTVDEDIKGGIIIKVGDEVLDGSVANQLKKLKNILSK